jgi:flagellar export protein FliJ
MTFKFRFQSVLNYRRHQAEIAEMELAEAQQQLVIAEEHLASLKAKREDGESRLAHRLQKGVGGHELQLWRLYLTDLETRIDEEAQRAEVMRLSLENVRARLLVANRKKKSMEKLFDQEEQAWWQQENKRQERELSEVAVRLHTGGHDEKIQRGKEFRQG